MLAAIIRAALKAMSLLSPARVLTIARGIAKANQWLHTETYKVTRRNIELCFPELDATQQRALVKESLMHTALLPFEFAQMVYSPTVQLRDQIAKIEGEALLDEAMRSGRGILIMMPHFGHFEFVSLLGGNYGAAALFKPPKLASLEAIITETRKRHGAIMYPTTAAGVRRLIRYMRNGNLVLMLPDQVPDRDARGTASTFFGQPVATMTLAHRIIKQNQPVVLFASIERVIKDQTLEYVFYIERPSEGVEGEDEKRYADAINASIERIVRRAPAQYQWEYKRFKRAPGHEEKQDSLYRTF